MYKFLIIDDHDVVRQGLRLILEKEFGEVLLTEAKDSKEAVDLLVKANWSLIFMDISMPGRCGLDLLEDCRRLNQGTPVLVLSCHTEPDFAIRSLRLGAAGYLNKQCSCGEMISVVKKILSGGKHVPDGLAERLAERVCGNGSQDPHEILSTRELEILCMVAMGKTLKAISAELALSQKTVETYRSRIAEKTGLATGIQLTRYAFQHHLVQ